MAKKEKNTKKKKSLLKAIIAVFIVGLILCGGTALFGLLTLARDLLYTAVFADALIAGGGLASKAVNKIKERKNSQKQKSRSRDKSLLKANGLEIEDEKDKAQVEELESLPEVSVVSTQTNVNTNEISTNKDVVRKQK